MPPFMMPMDWPCVFISSSIPSLNCPSCVKTAGATGRHASANACLFSSMLRSMLQRLCAVNNWSE